MAGKVAGRDASRDSYRFVAKVVMEKGVFFDTEDTEGR